MHRIKPEFYVDYHSFAKLVLYPVGWQVETYGGDTPLMEALAGTDRAPAVAGYDPDVGGELYTTNGEITDTMYLQEDVMGYTVELDGGAGTPVGGTTTTGNAYGSNPNGFVFQDREADVQDVFARNLPFMLDLARSAPTPDQPVSHLNPVVPDLVPVTFPTSYGDPQTVEVNVKRSLGAVTLKWQIEGSSTVYTRLDRRVQRRRALRQVGRRLPPHARLGHAASRPATRSASGSRPVPKIAATGSRSRRRRPGAATRCWCCRPRTTAGSRRTRRRCPARPSFRPTPTR